MKLFLFFFKFVGTARYRLQISLRYEFVIEQVERLFSMIGLIKRKGI